MRKWRRQSRAKSSQEEVVSPDDNRLIFSQPVRLYRILRRRSLSNPSFLPRCLSYKIKAKAERTSDGIVVFNYDECDNTLQTTPLTENFSCPFCYMRCGSFKGLKFHLNSYHDLYEYDFEFRAEEEEPTVYVSLRHDALGSEEEEKDQEKYEPYSFCSKSRKRRQRGGGNNAKRQKRIILPMDSVDVANVTADVIPLMNDSFLRRHKKELLSNSKLFWCWRLFVVKLHYMGLVDAATINSSNIILEQFNDNSARASTSNNNNNNSMVRTTINNSRITLGNRHENSYNNNNNNNSRIILGNRHENSYNNNNNNNNSRIILGNRHENSYNNNNNNNSRL